MDRSKFLLYPINGATVHNSNFKVPAFTKFIDTWNGYMWKSCKHMTKWVHSRFKDEKRKVRREREKPSCFSVELIFYSVYILTSQLIKKVVFTSCLSLYISFLILQFKALLYLSSVQLIDISDTTPMDQSFPPCPQASILLLLKFGSKSLARIIFLNAVHLKILMSET